MTSDNKYSVFSEDSESSFGTFPGTLADIYEMLQSGKGKKSKKKGKKGKKKGKKKKEKALEYLLNFQKESKKKGKGKKGKKGKKSKDKGKKRRAEDFKYRMIETKTDKALDSACTIAEMFAESKFFPNGRSAKSK